MIIPVDKPSGYTSHDVVSRIKHAVPGKIKIGHTGTLDPMCTGVLTVLTENYTRLSDILPSDKTYRASILFGIRTDTQDVTGTVIEDCDCDVSEAEFSSVADKFTGNISQLPPMYSAVKKNGVPLYKLAREGVEVERQPRTVTIYSIDDIEKTGKNSFSFTVSCSSGTYIRTLCEDMAAELGVCGCMQALRRTRANGFDIGQALHLEEVIRIASEGNIGKVGFRCEEVFSFLPAISIPDSGRVYYLNGGGIEKGRFGALPVGERFRAYDGDQRFLGLAQLNEEGKVCGIWKENL